MIKYILLDLGKVVLDFDHYLISKKLAKITRSGAHSAGAAGSKDNATSRGATRGIDAGRIHRAVFMTPGDIAFEKGEITPRGFFSRVKKELRLSVSYRCFARIWEDIFWNKPGMPALIRSLKKKYRLGLLSNTNKLHFEYAMKKFPVMKCFDDYFISYKLGLRKPDSRIYNTVLRKTGLKAEEIVYFDDISKFVSEAESMGFRAFVMKSAARCRRIITNLRNV